MKYRTTTFSSFLFLAPMALVFTSARSARAELSPAAQSRAWNIEHGVYTRDCDPSSPIPAKVDDQVVGKCEERLAAQSRELARFDEAEKKEARIQALFAGHAKFTSHVAKVKEVYEQSVKAVAAADADVETYKKETKENEKGLWFLKYLDEGRSVSDAESGLSAAISARPFAEHCKAKFAVLKPRFSNGEFLSEPKQTCGVAMRMDEIIRRELPKVLTQMRADTTQRSKSIREKLSHGEPIFASDLECAKDSRKCGHQEEAIARMTKIAGIAFPAPSEPSADGAYDSAMKQATATKRVGVSHDATREGALKAALKRSKITPLALGLSTPSDETETNDIGMVLRKFRTGQFLVRVSKEPFCRSYSVVTTAPYRGAGTFGSFVAADIKIDDANVKFVVSGCP